MLISFNNVVFDTDDVIDLLTHSETTCVDCNRDDCPFQALCSGNESCEASHFALYTILELLKVIDRRDDAIFAMVDQIVDLRTNLEICENELELCEKNFSALWDERAELIDKNNELEARLE